MQKINARVTFSAIECSNRLCVHSDASFKREEETGHGMRGAVYMRMGRCRRTGEEVCHLLHAVARSHKLVCRSSFGSELLAACGAADGLQHFLLTMHELVHGPADPSVARRLRDEGGYGSCQGAFREQYGRPSLVVSGSASHKAVRRSCVVRHTRYAS